MKTKPNQTEPDQENQTLLSNPNVEHEIATQWWLPTNQAKPQQQAPGGGQALQVVVLDCSKTASQGVTLASIAICGLENMAQMDPFFYFFLLILFLLLLVHIWPSIPGWRSPCPQYQGWLSVCPQPGRMAGALLIFQLVRWIVRWSVGRLVSPLVCQLVGWSVSWSVIWSVG